MSVDPAAVSAAAQRVLDSVATDPRYAQTSALRVVLDGRVVVDEHLRGPVVTDVFSVTKTVVATVVGIALGQGHVRSLDDPLGAVLDLHGTPAAAHTWRQVLSMTRGAAADGPYEEDEVTGLSGGWVQRIASAPQVHPPGEVFHYDSAATHLVTAALERSVPGGLLAHVEHSLFGPLGIDDWRWASDPDGVPCGFAHLALSAEALCRLGTLWLDRGVVGDRRLLPSATVDAMAVPLTPGGPPERRPYGLGAWVDGGGTWFAGGWGGQLVLVAPAGRAVVVTTGETGFTLGPPPSDRLPPDWRPALALVREHLLPVLRP